MHGTMALRRNFAVVMSLSCSPTPRQKPAWKVALSTFQQHHHVLPRLICLRQATFPSCFQLRKCVLHSADVLSHQCMRCHDVSRAQNCNTENRDKAEREERQQNRRLSAHQSATRTTHDLNRFSILCDSQKHTACLDTHHKACLKYSKFSTDQNTLWKTARRRGFEQFRFQHSPFIKSDSAQ